MSRTTRTVVDTNLLVSRLLVPSSIPGEAVRRAERAGAILVSAETLDELADVLNGPKLDRYVSIEERQEYLRLLLRIVEVVPVSHRVRVCRDPRDDMFLELAVSGEANFLVTGDRDLLELNPFRGIPIVTAAEYRARPGLEPSDRP